MDAPEFKAGCVEMWGESWRPAAVKAFDVNDSTIDRWANGQAKVHPSAAKLLEKLLADHRRRRSTRRRVAKHRAAKGAAR